MRDALLILSRHSYILELLWPRQRGTPD